MILYDGSGRLDSIARAVRGGQQGSTSTAGASGRTNVQPDDAPFRAVCEGRKDDLDRLNRKGRAGSYQHPGCPFPSQIQIDVVLREGKWMLCGKSDPSAIAVNHVLSRAYLFRISVTTAKYLYYKCSSFPVQCLV